jgi:AraC-like DNA-binding protein
MLTARTEVRDKLTALRLGVDDYLTKPFKTQELLARVTYLLRNTQQRQALLAQATNGTSPAEVDPVLSAADAAWLAQQEKLLKTKLNEPGFSASQWADAIALSERQLQRKLKSLTGLTPHQYLTEMRLCEAQALLEEGTYQTVAEVAYAVGFGSPQAFTRNFRKRFGKVPSAYG